MCGIPNSKLSYKPVKNQLCIKMIRISLFLMNSRVNVTYLNVCLGNMLNILYPEYIINLYIRTNIYCYSYVIYGGVLSSYP